MFSSVTEWRMTQIMRQASCFDSVRINPKVRAMCWLFVQTPFCKPSSNLCDLQRVLLACVKYFRFAGPNYLSYASQPSER
jgi:hypothetical protein